DIRVVLLEAEICGAGASGKNGGKCHGYWYALGSLIPIFGIEKSLELARMASRAQSEIAAFATAPGRDVWWREGGNLRVSTVPAHDARITAHQKLAEELSIPDTMYP